jgi:DNA-binding winged helix-turn-helix (wHTH) protein/tetratricopeptide (TPR) repeat protein
MTSFPPFRLDVINQCLWRGETRVSLMPKPFAVLRYLVEHPGHLVTHDELLAAIWPDTFVQAEVLRRYILEIRRALGDQVEAPRFIRTLPRRGYQFIAPVTDDAVANLVDTAASATRLVGRQSAQAALSGHLRSALGGHRQVVFVVGEAGIGKTSLVDAFQREAASIASVSVVRGQCVEGFGGKEAYYPLLEALGQLARGPSRTRVVETLGAHAPTWLVQFPSLVKSEQHAALQREIAGATRERMMRELCEALEELAQSGPLVLVLEDLHWVDRATLDIISVVARRREPARLMLVGTLRPADLILSESPLKALKQDLLLHRLSHEVELERLRESDVAEYVASEFSPADVPPALATAIYRHSDGNPLFMVAMLDHFAKTGALSQSNGRWTLTRPLEEINPGIPETLRQMLELQLQHATDAEQHLLKVASVAGQHFTVWSVKTMLPEDPADIEGICEALVERLRFLRPGGTRELTSEVSTAEYHFTHALYREVLYRKISPALRLTLHRRLAAGLEQLRRPVEPEMAGEIALHFSEGHEYEPAIRYAMLAAQNATRRYAHRQAVEILDHARELLPKIPEARRHTFELELLERTGKAYYALGDMQQSAATYESMAVLAAGAGVLATQADALMRLSHPAESVPFFLKAVELDPHFVSAYTTLSRIYSNLGEVERAKEYARRAYEHRDRVGERERLSITYQYHYEVTGDQACAGKTLEAWKQAFPDEFQPVNSLALMHNFLGQFDRAIEEGTEAVRRNPSHGYPYSNLAHAYRGSGQFAQARWTAEQAVARQIETLPTRRLLYQLALIAGEPDEARRHLEWAKDHAREFDMIGAHAQATAWSGKVGEARQLYESAARMAEQRNLADVGNSHVAWASSMELAYGNTEAAVRLARRVLARNPSYDPRLRAAAALAATRWKRQAQTITTELVTANPHHTLINAVLAPIVRAGLELGRKQPARALEELQAVAPYELGFIAALAPMYLRAQCYLMLRASLRAAQEFQRILDHRGSDPFSPFHAVAVVGLARAHAQAGSTIESAQAYERFLSAWTEADVDVPILCEARAEYAHLSGVRQ